MVIIVPIFVGIYDELRLFKKENDLFVMEWR